MAFLIGMSGDIKGKKFEITQDRIILGRNPNSDIVLNDEAVSSQHCYIVRQGSQYILHDLNSTNGTVLNFERVVEAELKPKQVIQIGSSELMFDAESTETSSTVLAANTQVVIDEAPPVAAPKSFSSVSPFGTRRKDSRGIWLMVFVFIGGLALAGLIFFLYSILK